MSKNLTRKGLALGAVVALATTLFAGAPAQAAGETISLAPSAGTSYKTLLGSTFELSSLFSGWGSAPAALTYKVTGVVASDLTGTAVSSAVDRATSGWTSKTPVDKSTPTSVAIPGATVTLGQAAQLKIKLDPTAVTATTTITVVAFNDSYLADGKIDAAGNEVQSAPVQITFVKPSEVTATTTLEAPQVGVAQSGLVAHVTLGDINLPLLDTALAKVIFKVNGSAIATTTGNAAPYVKADAALTSSPNANATTTLAATDVVTAQAVLSTTSGGTFSNSGSAAIAGVNAGSKTLVLDSAATPATDKSANVRVSSGYKVRSGTTSVKITSAAKWTNDDGVLAQSVGAGVSAKVTIKEATANSVDAASSISAGGKTLTNTDSTSVDSISYTTTTNADGKVVIDLSATGKKNDEILVQVEYLSAGSWVNNGGFVNYKWVDAARTADKLVRVGYVGSSAIGVKKGGSYTVTYNLVDEFGALVSDAALATDKRAVRLTNTGGTGVAINQVLTFSAGVATATLTDPSTAAQNYTLNATLQKDSSGSWVDATGSGTDAAVVTAPATVYAQSSVTPGFVTVVKDVAKPTRATEDFVTAFVDTFANVNSTAVVGTGDEVIHGVVTADDGNVAAGVAVTISGAGLQFVAVGASATTTGTADAAIAVGSITVYTDSNGAYSVKVKSHKAGSIVVTVASGSITKTTTPEWAAAAATAGSAIAITAPANVAAGTSTTIVVNLTDKYGNAVETTTSGVERLSVSVSGSGITGTIPATTDADGNLKFYQLLGASDTGSFVITVKYDADGTGTTSAQITKTATVTIGAAPVVAPAAAKANVVAKTKAFSVSVSGNASAKNVVVKVAGKTVATLKGSASAKTYTVKATKGSKKVTVYVGGKLIATKTVSVK